MEKPLEKLYQHVANLLSCKLELTKALEDLQREIVVMEGDWRSNINWSYLLEELKHEAASIDLNATFSFIDDIEEQINDVPYKMKRTSDSYKLAVNPILKNTPVFFDAANPPEDSDYFGTPTEK